MLSDIIKQASGWDTKALAKIFSNKKFLRSVDGDKEKYLADLISKDYEKRNITLPREIIPDIVTLDALYFTYKKDPSILPILLKYLTHKNLLQEAKDDLDKLNQKLQGVMDEELKKLQDELKLLCEETVELSGKKVDVKQSKVLVTKSEKITETASKIEKIKLYKEDIKNLLNGDKVKLRSYPSQYFSILNSGLIEIMEKKLTAYVKGDTDIGETYSSLNSRAKKIIRVRNVKSVLLFSSALACGIACMPFIAVFCQSCAGPGEFHYFMFNFFIHYSLPILLPTAATLFAIEGIAYLIERHYEQSFEKEMQDFIEGPKYVDKATNTEDVKESEQKETGVGDLIDLSGDHKEVQPSISSEQSESGMDLLVDLSEQPNSNVDSTLSGVTQVRESNVQLLRGIVIGKEQEIGV